MVHKFKQERASPLSLDSASNGNSSNHIVFKYFEEQYDDIKQINEEREKLIMKFKSIKN